YSSFVQAYNIDLIDMRNKLDWRKFYSLFLGLPESTKMREVMSIRARHIPFPTKNNQEEIRSLNELKAYWFLPCDIKENYQTELNNLFNGLKNLAKKT
ncbi:MAG: Gp15 family bacteriophage protein, partial [Clostridia bacterium]